MTEKRVVPCSEEELEEAIETHQGKYEVTLGSLKYLLQEMGDGGKLHPETISECGCGNKNINCSSWCEIISDIGSYVWLQAHGVEEFDGTQQHNEVSHEHGHMLH